MSTSDKRVEARNIWNEHVFSVFILPVFMHCLFTYSCIECIEWIVCTVGWIGRSLESIPGSILVLGGQNQIEHMY